MKLVRKCICLLLVLAMVSAWLPAHALAVTATHTGAPAQFGYAATKAHFNPFYPATADMRTVDKMPAFMPSATSAVNGYPTDLQKPAKVLREGMVQRQNIIGMRYAVPAGDFDESQEAADALLESIFNAAVVHTGVPNEGDALRWVYNYYQAAFYYVYLDGYYLLDITFNVDYYTNNKQEATLDAMVETALSTLPITEETSDYETVKAVYDYVCANVVYDYENLSNPDYLLQYTAYAALVNGTSVCQGYAVLMYRFLLELGIDCRVIAGIGNGGPHAWNIVKLGEYYYNLDSTWDAGMSEYSFFLRTEDNFPDHTREEEFTTDDFHRNYPMADADFAPENDAAAHTHQYEGVVTPPTCSAEGYTTYTCTICGKSYTGDPVEKLPHTYDEGVVTEPTCQKQGYTTYTCTLCGATVADNYVDMVPHEYTSEVIPPSCQNNGYTRYDCINCEWFYTDNYVPASHEYVEEVKVGTCTDFGYTTRTCTLCGDSYQIDYVLPTGHTLGEDFLCIVCGRPEYVLYSGLEAKELVLGEDGVYYTPYGDVAFVAVKLQRNDHIIDDTLYNSVRVFGDGIYSLTYLEQILDGLNADGCLMLTVETMVWIRDLLQDLDEQDDWHLSGYLCYVRDHDHEYETTTTPPTCTEWGNTKQWCIHCGYVADEYQTPPQHSYDDGVVTPPTCQTPGYTTVTCTICGDYYEYNYTTGGDHVPGEESVVTPPTCTSEGYTTYTCTLCGELIYADYVPPIDHTPDANCVCSVCGTKVYLVDIGLELEMLVLGEDGAYYTPFGDPVMIAIRAPLDNWLGGYSLYDYVQEFGSYYFSMTYWKDLQAAVNADGYAPLTSDTLVWMLDLITGNPAWGEDETYLTYYLAFPVDHTHIYETYEEAATCTQMGLIMHTCTECGISIWEYTYALGHELDENFVCTVCGVRVDYVIDCGMQLKDFVLGADGLYYTQDGYLAVIAVSAPLDSWLGGNSLADYVYVYGESLFDLTWWDALLELANADGYVLLTSATLSWLEDVITGNPASGQTYEDLTHYIGYCVKCSHSYSDGVVVQPTCTENGYTIYWCTFCGESYTGDETPALGHSYATVVTDPTCTTEGYTTYTCTLCGDSYVADYVPATGHSFAEGQCVHCGAQEEIKVLLGDVNGDGKINTSDAKLIMQYELGLIGADALNLAAADVNGDGKFNTSDAKLIMQYELGLITGFRE